jgi:DNA-binding GntR family transcriptional regulator
LRNGAASRIVPSQSLLSIMQVSPLTLRIARDIASLIGSGEIGPNDHIATQGLADRFSVSRSPVREALKILAERGVIEQQANRGYFVSQQPMSEIGVAKLELPDAEDTDPYFVFAEDWLLDQIPGDVTEQFVRERYRLTKSQTLDMLSRAAREGWAQPKPGYGWTLLAVAKTGEAVEQIYRFRAVIEPAALLEPSFVFDSVKAASLRRIQERMLEGDIERLSADTLLSAGVNFHEELCRMSGNPIFHQSLVRANQLRKLIEHRLSVSRDRLNVQCREHLVILDLVERSELFEAAHVMRRHLSGALAVKSPIIGGRLR